MNLYLCWLRSILLGVFGLIFSLGIHLLPGYSQIIPHHDLKEVVSRENLSTEQLVERGKTLYQAGQFNEASQNLQLAVNNYQSQGDLLNQSLALSYFALASHKLGHWDRANQAVTTSLKLLNKLELSTKDSQHVLALTYNTQGKLFSDQGHAENAFDSWQKAGKIYTQINDEPGRIGSLINQASALQSLGLYRRTTQVLEEVKKGLLAQPNSTLKVAGLRSLGNTLLASGDLESSRKILEQSLAAAKQLGSNQEEGATLLSLGNVTLAEGQRNLLRDTSSLDNPLPLHCQNTPLTDKNKSYYEKAASIYLESANKSSSTITAVQAQLNRLTVLQYLQQQPSTQELEAIQSALSSLTPSRDAVYARVNFAQSLVCLDQAEKISRSPNPKSQIPNPKSQIQNLKSILVFAVEQAKEIKDTRAESYALGNLGQIYEINKEWTLAQKNTESALNLAQMMNAPDITYLWQWQLGRLLFNQGKSEQAITSYSAAVETLKSIRSDLVALNPDVQFDFRDRVEPVYRQLVALLLHPEGAKGSVSQKNLKQARDVIEALQLAELDNFFRDACIIVHPEPIDKLVDNANPATAIFYPIILRDRLELIVKFPQVEELKNYTTYKSQKEVENILDSLLQKLKKRYTFRDRELLSQEVYNWIIKPVEQDLASRNVKNLVFVLDGSLRNIPIASLYDGKQYLIEKYSVSLSPGLQLFATAPKRKKIEALAAGLTESRLGFSALPNVAIELEKIQSVVNSKELINRDFTDTSIEKKVSSESFPVVHLATHGKFSSQLEETFILAWNGKINVKQLRDVLQTREQVERRSFRVPPPIELLVLSACETATGDKRAALGLAGVAVRSGARSTIASLWQVDDKSTSMLMGEFYKQLTSDRNITKAEALRRAQVSVLKQYEEHPFYWAPYILVGNWL